MRAFQISQFGLEHLDPVELPTPVPGTGEVLVRVRAVSLNYRDLLMVRGHYDPKLHLPRIPLSDGAGEVVEIGEGVTGFRLEIASPEFFCRTGRRELPPPPNPAARSAEMSMACSPNMSRCRRMGYSASRNISVTEEASTLPCAAVTAWNALIEAARVKPGDTIVIQGTGGVSIFALQFAKLCGVRVLGTSSSEEKLAKAMQLGLDAGLNYRQHPRWAAWVKEQTQAEGADAIIEVGGAGTLANR